MPDLSRSTAPDDRMRRRRAGSHAAGSFRAAKLVAALARVGHAGTREDSRAICPSCVWLARDEPAILPVALQARRETESLDHVSRGELSLSTAPAAPTPGDRAGESRDGDPR